MSLIDNEQTGTMSSPGVSSSLGVSSWSSGIQSSVSTSSSTGNLSAHGSLSVPPAIPSSQPSSGSFTLPHDLAATHMADSVSPSIIAAQQSATAGQIAGSASSGPTHPGNPNGNAAPQADQTPHPTPDSSSGTGKNESRWGWSWKDLSKKALTEAARMAGIDAGSLVAELSKHSETIEALIKHPGQFVSNLIHAIVSGFRNFAAHFLPHLEKGFVGWLGGISGEAGITIPSTLDAAGIFSLISQVLSLTKEMLKQRVLKHLGLTDQPGAGTRVVKFFEQTWHSIEALLSGGWAGLWEHLKEFAGNLKDEVINTIQQWLLGNVVTSAVLKIASMFTPAGALVQLVTTLWNIFQFLRDQGQRISGLLSGVTDSLHDIASSKVEGAVSHIERSLADVLPVALQFLAAFAGIGGVGQKVRQIIERVRDRVLSALDKLIEKVVVRFKPLFQKNKGHEDSHSHDASKEHPAGHENHPPDGKSVSSEKNNSAASKNESKHAAGPPPMGWQSQVVSRIASEKVIGDDPGHTYHLLKDGRGVATSTPRLLSSDIVTRLPHHLDVSPAEEAEIRRRAGRDAHEGHDTDTNQKDQTKDKALVNKGTNSLAHNPAFERAALAFEIKLGSKANRHDASRNVAKIMCEKAKGYIMARAGARWDAADENLKALLIKTGSGDVTWSGSVGHEIHHLMDVFDHGSLSERMAHLETFFTEILGAGLLEANGLNQVLAAIDNARMADNTAVDMNKARIIADGTQMRDAISAGETKRMARKIIFQPPADSPVNDQWHTRAARPVHEYENLPRNNVQELGMDMSNREHDFARTKDPEWRENAPVKWLEGARKWIINERDKWVYAQRRMSLPLAAGPSGTTNKIMSLAKILNVNLYDTRLACMGYMLAKRDHSLVEIMSAAAPHGCSFTHSQKMYRDIKPLLPNELLECGGGHFPDETPSDDRHTEGRRHT